MRSRHRGAAEQVEVASPVAGRRDRREDVQPGGDQVRLEQVTPAGDERAARREGAVVGAGTSLMIVD